ncbi:MAG TPA: hypothetical protein PKO15_11750 [Fibrobacteria bacterium]|nr:hypothetical protein [Fibrobacteria bacterium]
MEGFSRHPESPHGRVIDSRQPRLSWDSDHELMWETRSQFMEIEGGVQAEHRFGDSLGHDDHVVPAIAGPSCFPVHSPPKPFDLTNLKQPRQTFSVYAKFDRLLESE